MNTLAGTVVAPAVAGSEIRRGIFRGFGMRHVVLVLLFTVAFDVLGQLGWADFGQGAQGRRWWHLMQMPMHLAIGFAAILAAVMAENAINAGPGRLFRYPLAVLVASVAGTVLLAWWMTHFGIRSKLEYAAVLHLGGAGGALLALSFLKASYICIMVVALHAVFEASRRASAALHAARMAALESEHEVIEGDLRVMQARIDPELLFESLRNVDSAYAVDSAIGQARLDAVIRFLRAALPGEVAATSTVAREQELAEAYAALAATGDAAEAKLDFVADDAVRAAAMPSMLLLPLIRWALAGAPADGLRVRVRRRETQREPGLEITVENRVRGAPGPNYAEAEGVRARLERLYGDRAQLHCSSEGGRRCATVNLPLGPSARAHT